MNNPYVVLGELAVFIFIVYVLVTYTSKDHREDVAAEREWCEWMKRLEREDDDDVEC